MKRLSKSLFLSRLLRINTHGDAIAITINGIFFVFVYLIVFFVVFSYIVFLPVFL